MSKNPTKAADNAFCIARKKAAAFNDKLNSREGAAEALGLDRTRIARVELGSLFPYPEEVLLMADGYNAPELLNHYCCDLCPIGRRSQQRLEVAELDRLTVKLISAMRRGDDIKGLLLDITEDGVIDTDERPQLERILAYLDGISKAAAELRLWAEKNLGEED